MLSRLAVGALVLSGALLGVVRADPPTFCAPVTIDVFSVTASTTGGDDTEGSEIVAVTGDDSTSEYYYALASNYPSSSVFFNIELTPNVTSQNYNGLQSYGFSIELNGAFATNPASGTQYYNGASNSGTVSNIEFRTWHSSQTAAVNNTLILNVTEFIQKNANAHITQCDYLYYFTFNNPVQTSVVVGDPQFVGLRGQSYQVHGIDGAVYNIISQASTQVNSRFVFLTQGVCPIVNGHADSNCWSHPGSYLGEMSFQALVDGALHAALIQSGSAAQGFAGVQVDGKALTVGETASYGVFSVEFVSSHSVAVTTADFSFLLSNSDHFINQQLRATTPLSQLKAHGLLGQTHAAKTYANALKHVEGDVDDYVVQDGNIFGSDFLFNQFRA